MDSKLNERIQELAEQADPEHWHSRWYSGISPRVMDPEIKKFAELIVRECANRATWAQDTGEKDIGGEVLKHFGVEE
jgi:hypothetical protein